MCGTVQHVHAVPSLRDRLPEYGPHQPAAAAACVMIPRFGPCGARTAPGHELSGVVAEVGEGTTRFTVGQRVAVPFILSCGACRECGARVVSESPVSPPECLNGCSLKRKIIAARVQRFIPHPPSPSPAERPHHFMQAVTRAVRPESE